MLTATLAVLAACGGAAGSGPETPTPRRPAPAGATTVALDSAPEGTATLRWDPNTKLITADITAYGFTPGSAHAMHIHPGTCANQNQPPSVAFADVHADTHGDAHGSIPSQPAPAGIPTGSYLNIHLAPMARLGTPKDISFTPILCADIPPGTPATGPVTLNLHAPPVHGAAPSGTATLTYKPDTHTLVVQVKASGLPPGGGHAVHIHTGTCHDQGDVLYPLPDLTANSTGQAQESTTINHVASAPPASGWYVNVHFGPMSTILANGTPTLLFAPILCGNVPG